MANRTVKEARTVHGTNPQYILEKIIRTRIYESRFWKEDCFALNAELIVDKGMELRYIGGIYGGNIKPTPFLCLTLKLLQIQPDKDIIIEFIRQEDFKYIRALGAFYLRLTGESLEVYKYLEPLYNDFRKLRRMDRMGQFDVVHMDEFIDLLLREERVFDVILPRIQKREIHEESGELEQRTSVLDEDLDADMEFEEEEEPVKDMKEKHSSSRTDKSRKSSPPRRHRSRSRSPARRERRSRSPYSRSTRRSRSRSRDRDVRESRRERSRSRDRTRKRSKSPKRDKVKKTKKDKKDKDKPSDDVEDEKAKAEALSIAQSNAIRAQLGLKPLK